MKSFFCIIAMLGILCAYPTNAQQVYEADNGITASGSSTTRKVSLGGTLNNALTTIDFGSSNSSSSLLIKKGSTNYFSIANGGNIGIGTTSPATALHLHGAYTQTSPTYTGTFKIDFSANGAISLSTQIGDFMTVGPLNSVSFGNQELYGLVRGAYFSNSQGGSALETSVGNVKLNTTNGNTLIGTTTDDATNKLQVNGNIKANSIVLTSGAAAGKVLTSDASGNATWQTGGSSSGWGLSGNTVGGIKKIGALDSYDLSIITNDVNRIWVGSTGNVAIGNTSPQERLDVSGNLRLDGKIWWSWGSRAIEEVNINGGSLIRFRNSMNASAGNANGGFDFAHWDGESVMRITDGKVGIGTTKVSDPGYKLFVETGIRTRKVKVDQATWSDYVFYPGYKLPSLAEVEKFIKANNHLPDVPSAAEVEKDGLNLGDNQAVLLKKIEELTLYVIEQNKRMIEMETKLKTLEKRSK